MKAALQNGTGNIPVLNCRGSHYQVGRQVGQTFQSMIHNLLDNWKYFNEVVLVCGNTTTGRNMLLDSLAICSKRYPGYVDEIRGMADGADIAFEKLFMLNIDSILTTMEEIHGHEEEKKSGGTGCTTLICNKDEIILGHTEDAMAEIKDHVYIISAEILNDDGNLVEKVTTLCYAGTLMGYTMGFNNHGMVYSVNTIFPTVYTAGMPRSFIARALLGASSLEEVVNIMKDKGNGIADGFSLNVYFYSNNNKNDQSASKFYNIEVAPPLNSENESVVDVHEIHPGCSYTHCNRYSRIKTTEVNDVAVDYSDKRLSTIGQLPEADSEKNVKAILSDASDYNYPIFNSGGDSEDYTMNFIRTVAVGIFNMNKKTWSVYTSPPKTGNPDCVFNIM